MGRPCAWFRKPATEPSAYSRGPRGRNYPLCAPTGTLPLLYAPISTAVNGRNSVQGWLPSAIPGQASPWADFESSDPDAVGLAQCRPCRLAAAKGPQGHSRQPRRRRLQGGRTRSESEGTPASGRACDPERGQRGRHPLQIGCRWHREDVVDELSRMVRHSLER